MVPPEHGNPTPANDDVQSYATDAYERIVGLVEKRVHREGELFESPAAPETAMI